MKKDIAFSLSIQREIEKHRLNVESEVNKSMNELGIRTLLHQSGIQKEKGFPTVTLLFALIVLPVSASSWLSFNLSGLESGRFSCCQASFSPPILSRMSSSICLTYLKIRSSTPRRRGVRNFSNNGKREEESRCLNFSSFVRKIEEYSILESMEDG